MRDWFCNAQPADIAAITDGETGEPVSIHECCSVEDLKCFGYVGIYKTGSNFVVEWSARIGGGTSRSVA